MASTNGGESPPGVPPSTGPRHSGRAATNGPPLARILHWGLITGGLVIIADLGSMALLQQAGSSPETTSSIEVGNLLVNVLIYSIAGARVALETGRWRPALAVGLIAGLLAGMVVGAATAATTPPDAVTNGAGLELVMGSLTNAWLGTMLTAGSAWAGTISRRPKKGR